MHMYLLSARMIKIERPLYGVEVFVGETARFEVEISEPDVHAIWKLKGETLTASPVSLFQTETLQSSNIRKIQLQIYNVRVSD